MLHAFLPWLLLAGALLASPAVLAQSGGARSSMEQCVDRVLARLARAKAPEREVGRAVISGCDGPLRATLAEAIKSGEARMCASIESCIDIARKRAGDEAKEAYRAGVSR